MTPARLLHFLIALLVAGSAAHASVDFKKEILPLLENHCLKCHRAAHEENGRLLKPKGDVRLDAAWALLACNKKVTPVTPKDVAHSDMIRVVTLPRDDDKAMPPEGKAEPLTPAEVVKLKIWMTEGADFGGWEGNVAGKPAAAGLPTPAKVREHELLYKKLAEGLEPIATDVGKKVQAATGAQITPISPGNPLLRVDFLNGVSQCDDNAVAALAPIRENVAHLDLARTGVTDEALKTVARMSRLTRLDLRRTRITDAGVAHLGALKNLVYLNLFGAEITDEALVTLASIKSLKNVCLFETRSTDGGVDKLKAALPGAEIIFRADFSAPAKTATAK